MSKPIAVLISDIHFNINNLPLASVSLKVALRKAEDINVPLVIAGDTNDTKAIIRAEVANAILGIVSQATVPIYALVGNHDLVNEKGSEHGLKYLTPYVDVVQSPVQVVLSGFSLYLIPYYNSPEALQEVLAKIPKGSTLIMHQGVQGAHMGEYVVDKTSLPKECFADFRVISGHYHRAQDIKCGRPRKGAVGLFSYIGTPYTTSFAEANDGPKGFQILSDDGLLTQVPTNLRRHMTFERTTEELARMMEDGPEGEYGAFFGLVNKEDLVWLKVRGPQSELAKLKKKEVGLRTLGHANFKLDLIAAESAKVEETDAKPLSETDLLDKLIDGMEETDAQKKILKGLWREVLS